MRSPTVITGMFRSGTTHLWRLLSADPWFTASYCEPLHPELPREMNVHAHFSSYLERLDLIQSCWRPDFSSSRLLLNENDSWPELELYLRQLLIPGVLVKFVRMNLRMRWFSQFFQNAFVINLVRDPRAVCMSMLHHPTSSQIMDSDIPWLDWHAQEYYIQYSAMVPFRDQLLMLKDELPYVKILALWKINIEHSLFDLGRYGGNGMVVRHEDLCTTTDQELARIYDKMGRMVSNEVLTAARISVGSERPWQHPTTTEGLLAYKKVDSSIWAEGIEKANLHSTMKDLGYDE